MARSRLRFTQTDLKRALRGAAAAGQPVQRFEIDREGKIVVIFGRARRAGRERMGRNNLMRRPPKYVHGFIDRHGRPRFYFRRAGFKKVPLPGLPWSSQFMEAYEQAVVGQSPSIDIGANRTKP